MFGSPRASFSLEAGGAQSGLGQDWSAAAPVAAARVFRSVP